MKYLFFILATLGLCANELSEPIPEENPKNLFGYFSLGSCGFVLPVLSPEASVGLRKLTAKHAWDVQCGAGLTGKYTWGQVSYLYFFLPTNKISYSSPYLGIGLSGGFARLSSFDSSLKNSAYINAPITVGFQWGEKQRNQFLQIQFSPLLITTASFGVGF